VVDMSVVYAILGSIVVVVMVVVLMAGGCFSRLRSPHGQVG